MSISGNSNEFQRLIHILRNSNEFNRIRLQWFYSNKHKLSICQNRKASKSFITLCQKNVPHPLIARLVHRKNQGFNLVSLSFYRLILNFSYLHFHDQCENYETTKLLSTFVLFKIKLYFFCMCFRKNVGLNNTRNLYAQAKNEGQI